MIECVGSIAGAGLINDELTFVACKVEAMEMSTVLLSRQVRLQHGVLVVSPILAFMGCSTGAMGILRVQLQRQVSLSQNG